MLTIKVLDEIPTSSYFSFRRVEPIVNRGYITIYDGQGDYRYVNKAGQGSGARCAVTSTPVLIAADIAAFHLSFYHRKGGDQGWRYYRPDETDPTSKESWIRILWKDIRDVDRARILIAFEDLNMPSWVKTPGKLRDQYKKPVMTVSIGYKYVQVIDDRYYSVKDDITEYIIGKRLMEKAVTNHKGGYYTYPSINGLESLHKDKAVFNSKFYKESHTLALLKCEISGNMEYYNLYGESIDPRYRSSISKTASTYIRPIEVVKTILYEPEPAQQEVVS